MTGRPITRTGLAAAALPVVAAAVFALSVAATLLAASAAGTLGYDYLAYDAAARRLLGGEPLYDTGFAASGTFGLFYYPPPFILLVLPFAALLTPALATWTWIGLLLVAFWVGVAILPVSGRVKWLVVLAAAVQWPFVYALKLGQVGPLLFLCFAAGWRWLDRPVPLAAGVAVGSLVKIQPALLVGWAALTGRWRAAALATIGAISVAIVATLVTGLDAWFAFLDLVRRVSDPITTPRNLTPGAVAYQLGADRALAAVVQVVASMAVLLVAVLAARRSLASASFLVAVIASQLISPILWDHYAMLTLLPMAWLLQRGYHWALLAPAVMSIPLIDVTPAVAYLAVLVLALVAPWLLGGRQATGEQALVAATEPSPVARG